MSPFLRIGFSSFEMDPGLAYHEEVLNPYCAVYMKEAVETGKKYLCFNYMRVVYHKSVKNIDKRQTPRGSFFCYGHF